MNAGHAARVKWLLRISYGWLCWCLGFDAHLIYLRGATWQSALATVCVVVTLGSIATLRSL